MYEISYWKGTEAQKLVLDYKVDVKKEHSLEGWNVGLKHRFKNENYQKKAQWLFDHTYDVKKGDLLSIVKKKESLEIYLNDKIKGRTSDPIVMELAFEPWLGEKPVDDRLKSALLGKQE